MSGCVSGSPNNLDRETQSSYSLSVTAQDQGHLSDTTQLTVTIQDCNDNVPQFDVINIHRNITEGTKVFIPPLSVLVGTPNALEGLPLIFNLCLFVFLTHELICNISVHE